MIPHPLNSNITLCICIRKYLHESDTTIDKTDHCRKRMAVLMRGDAELRVNINKFIVAKFDY